MTIRATKEKSGHCPRCREDVRTVRPWPHWRKVRYGYFAVLGCALLGSPVLLCDGFVLIPTLMLFMAAIGPLNALIQKPITCMQCGGPCEAMRHLQIVESKPGVAPSFFRSLRRRSGNLLANRVSKTKLARLRPELRPENVGDRDRRSEQHQQHAAPKQALPALDHE
jgi:hypothetical protein